MTDRPGMSRRTLGKTGIEVSELGLGLSFNAQYGDEVNGRGIRAALDAGINYLDTAAFYSDGLDEEVIGHALQGRRHEVSLATKVGYFQQPNGHRSVGALTAQLDGSLKRLRTEHVDVIQIHEADFRRWWTEQPITSDESMGTSAPLIEDDKDYDFAGAPVMEFLRTAKAAGKVRFVGITAKDARRAARIVKAVDVDTVMVAHQLNPIMRNAAEFLLPETEARDVGVLIAAPLMRGILAKARPYWVSEPPAWMDGTFLKAYAAFVDIADRTGMSMPELTMRWLLGEPRKHAIVFGFRSADDVGLNVRSAELGPLPPPVQAELDAIGIVHPLVSQGRTSL